MHLKLTLSLAVIIGSGAAAFAGDGAFKEFKSWQVSCSQTQSCSMRQYLSDNPLSNFELQRRGGPESPVSLVFAPSESAILEAGSLEVSIAIDGGAPLPISAKDVAVDTEAQARRALDFLGLDWDPACLDFHRSERGVQTPSRWQVRQPVHTRSIGRWRHYAAAMPPLLQALGYDPDAA